jgi:pimeloyl-ACP methyl ester carboxylesterase
MAIGAGVAASSRILGDGRPRPFRDAHGRPLPGSVSDKAWVEIDGVRQGMLIKGVSDRNPVLLYLHGGLPETFLTQTHPTGLEDLFTTAWWERRGCGLSFRADLDPASISLDQLVDDTLAVTDYLRARFGHDRVYLMGHSGGSFVAIHAAARAPQRYHAYVGVAQMANQLRSEIRAYQFMLREYGRRGDDAMVRRLEAAPVTPETGTPAGYLAIRDTAMHRLGIGTMHDMHSILTGLLLPSLVFREYTVREKIGLWRGKVRSGVSALWPEMLATDLAEAVPSLAIPAYFLHGIHDLTCSFDEARAYVARLEAPVKGFYPFAESAHSPNFEEPELTRRILRDDVLLGRSNLAASLDGPPSPASDQPQAQDI